MAMALSVSVLSLLKRKKTYYYISTEIYPVNNSPNKHSLSLMRSNRIGHTIFLTSEKYRMTNQKPDTIFSHVRKSQSVFPALRGGHAK